MIPPIRDRRQSIASASGMGSGRTGINEVDHPNGAFMGLAILILIVALIVGGVGLFVDALQLLLWVGLILLILSFFTGYRARRRI